MANSDPETAGVTLARNLLSALSTPAFLADEGGLLIFYNEAAGIAGLALGRGGQARGAGLGSPVRAVDDGGEPIPSRSSRT